MGFTFNIGGIQNDETYRIAQICQKHFACEACPVLEQGGLTITSQFGQPIKLSCSTTIIKDLKNGRSKM